MKKLHILTIIATLVFLLPPGLQAEDKKDASSEASPAKEKVAKEKIPPFHGKVGTVDATAKTFTLEGGSKARVFTVTSDTALEKGSGSATFEDIKAGEEVRGRAKKTGEGTYEAVKVKIGPLSEEDKLKKEEKAAKKAAKSE